MRLFEEHSKKTVNYKNISYCRLNEPLDEKNFTSDNINLELLTNDSGKPIYMTSKVRRYILDEEIIKIVSAPIQRLCRVNGTV